MPHTSKPQRRPNRLKGYDYTIPGAYFVTTVIADRAWILSTVSEGRNRLTKCGLIVQKTWADLPLHYPNLQLGENIVMPNHFHGILILSENIGASNQTQKRQGIPEIMRAFKSFSAQRINLLLGTPGRELWQRSYYDHIINNENEWDRIHQYILSNPEQWEEDELYR